MIFNIAFFVFSFFISFLDCTKYKIPNIMLLALLTFLITFGYLENKLNFYSFIFSFTILLFYIIILIVIPKIILGGGDIKYMMVIAIYLSPNLFPIFLICTGLIQLLFLIYYQKIRKRRVAPMAPSMFLSTIVTIVLNKIGLLDFII